MIIHYSRNAKEQIEQYYENYEDNYQYGYGQTDLRQRADSYRKIADTLLHIEHYLDQTYVKDNQNFIDVYDIATIEYEIENNRKEIIVKNIYFNDDENETLLSWESFM